MIRFVSILLFLLMSLLGVLRAPAYPFWLLSILVTEFPWVFAGITALLLVWAIRGDRYRWASGVAGAAAIVLFLSPVVRAYGVADGLEGKLGDAFGKGGEGTGGSPFRWWKMVTLYGETKVAYKTFQYGVTDGVPLTLDLYKAQRPGRRPCVIVIHGGSWSSGDSRQLPELNSRLAKEGYQVAAINYRLAPRYQNPAPVEDLRSALAWLRTHAEESAIDTSAFVLLGRSAGAQIALLAAYTLDDPGIKGVISFYGPADMVWGYSIPSNPLIMDSRRVMSDYLGGRYDAVPQNYINSSPIGFVTRRSVPTLLIHGKQDVLVAYEHSVRLNQRLSDSGVRHFLLTLPWATHGFDYTLHGPGGQLSTYSVEKFLQAVTNR
ncbi:MAG TPA: alpha/beta hydrolase [Puia sp.]|jgi:acetyl esterase/lipase